MRLSARSTAARSALVALIGLAGVGCQRPEGATLTIATDLDEPVLREIAREFAAWAEQGIAEGEPRPEVHWIRTSRNLDPIRLIGDGHGVDFVLTTSRVGAGSDPPLALAGWWVFPGPAVGLLLNGDLLRERALPDPEGWATLDDPRLDGLIALDDPRHDPVTLALLSARLSAGDWSGGYTALVRAAGQSLPFGRTTGSASALVQRGGVAVGPAVLDGPEQAASTRGLPVGAALSLGVGVAEGAPRDASTAAFLEFLQDRHELVPASRHAAMTARLLASLLGSTLVDAQGELVGALDVLARRPSPRLEAFLTEAPPWPPASVQELAKRDPGGSLVEQLAAELTTDLESRTWLLNRWEQVPRPLDGRLLDDLAAASDGKLVAEPRFLDWLATEWTAWARQRYRRVARQARAEPLAANPEPPAGAVR